MIEEIVISDLGVIGETTLELGPGFTVVTGETGAGKTMIVTALGLLLGARADAGSVRRGAPSAVVEGRWHVPEHDAVAERVEDAGGTVEDGELILTRTVSAEGRSRATVGGRSAPVAVLGELADQLVTVHGQSDQIRLTSASAQRAALDGFGGAALAKALARYVAAYDTWQEHTGELETLVRDRDDRVAEAERIRAASDEIEAADPQPGEDVELAERAERLGNLEELRLSAGLAHEALSSESLDDSPDVIGLVESARRAVERVAGRTPRCSPSSSSSPNSASRRRRPRRACRATSARSSPTRDTTSSSSTSVARCWRTSPASTATPSTTSSRTGSGRATGCSSSTVTTTASWACSRRRTGRTGARAGRFGPHDRPDEGSDGPGEAGHRRAADPRDGRGDPRRRGHRRRRVPPARAGPGRDPAAAALGHGPPPIGKGASGGELSRVMLAIEVVMAGSTTVPTFVFDEVDAGVGGAAAIEIGRRLAKLAERTQVIVVTHLAQVAAFANNHLNVVKDASGAVTSSSVRRLEGEDRLQEMARLLSGLGDSASGIEHARELLDVAGQRA